MGCRKTLLAGVAIRKRCGSAFWRNPTANTALAVCCARSTVFRQPVDIRVNPRDPRRIIPRLVTISAD
jgi:hypothetical protein